MHQENYCTRQPYSRYIPLLATHYFYFHQHVWTGSRTDINGNYSSSSSSSSSSSNISTVVEAAIAIVVVVAVVVVSSSSSNTVVAVESHSITDKILQLDILLEILVKVSQVTRWRLLAGEPTAAQATVHNKGSHHNSGGDTLLGSSCLLLQSFHWDLIKVVRLHPLRVNV